VAVIYTLCLKKCHYCGLL